MLKPVDSQGNILFPVYISPVTIAGGYSGGQDLPVLSSAQPEMSKTVFLPGEAISFRFTLDPNATRVTASVMTADEEEIFDTVEISPSSRDCAIPLSQPAGEYAVVLRQYADGYVASIEQLPFSVEGELLPGPELTMSTAEVLCDTFVTFSSSMEGATGFRFRFGDYIVTTTSADGTASVDQKFYEERSVEYSVSALGSLSR